MLPRGSFERRLFVVLILVSVLPAVLALGAGAWTASRAAAMAGAAAGWERVAGSGYALVQEAEARDETADGGLADAASRHRRELAASLVQARRLEFLLSRSLRVAVVFALLAGVVLAGIAFGLARRLAREMARPVDELVGWTERIARGEPLPPPVLGEDVGDEFARLRGAVRSMADEVAASRERGLEEERSRTWISMARKVAHELKNPLTPIRLAVRSLAGGGAAPERMREALEVLTAETERLDALARAFAQFGRLPEGPPSEVDLREMLEYLLRTHLPADRPWRLDAGKRAVIRGHHDALARAFANLILNAAEAAGERPGSIDVAVRESEEAVEVEVRDPGPGLPEEILPRIWEPDFTTKPRGTGLGLALVRQIVRAHEGEAEAFNLPGGGAAFRVRLPAVREVAVEAACPLS
jgi:signal transduction histidine kinase